MAEIERIGVGADLPGAYAYNLACVCALASAAVRSDSRVGTAEASRRAEAYARRAVSLLGVAEAAGFFRRPGALAHARVDTDLEALRKRADFQDLLARAAKTEPAGNTSGDRKKP
jgi:hypothetical protein